MSGTALVQPNLVQSKWLEAPTVVFPEVANFLTSASGMGDSGESGPTPQAGDGADRVCGDLDPGVEVIPDRRHRTYGLP